MTLTRDYNDLSGLFGKPGFSSASPSSRAEDNGPAIDSLESLAAPKTNLQTIRVNTPAVDPNKPNAQALATENAQKTAGAMEANKRTEASFEREMSQRAGEALAAEKYVGGTAFTPKMDTPTGAELALTAASGMKAAVAAQGLGSMVTGKMMGSASKGTQVLDVLNDRQMSSDEALNAVCSILEASSTPAEDSFGTITQASDSERVQVGAGVDWGQIIEQHGPEAVRAIVEYNPNDPSAMFPGMRDLKDAIRTQEEELEKLVSPENEERYTYEGALIAGTSPKDFPSVQAHEGFNGAIALASLSEVDKDALGSIFDNEPPSELRRTLASDLTSSMGV